MHSDDRAAVRRAIDDAVRLGVPYRPRFRFVQPGGTVRWAVATGVVERAESGEAVTLIGVSHDITERVQAEEQRNVLATSVQHKDDMVAVVSDELSQSLGAILVEIQLMEACLDRASGEEARRAIAQQVRHLSQVVKDLREASR